MAKVGKLKKGDTLILLAPLVDSHKIVPGSVSGGKGYMVVPESPRPSAPGRPG